MKKISSQGSASGGMGMSKHRTAGHTTKSPKFRHGAKLDAERNSIPDRSRIRDPKSSVEELFHGKKK